MLKADQRVAILLHEGILGSQGKTGLTLLRYSEAPIVAAIDRECAGKSLPELTRIPRDVGSERGDRSRVIGGEWIADADGK